MPGAIADQAARQQAIDPLRSFCVSAPAGSGKTELLIQRSLTLLARVEQPEEVLAITFTRKAAAEMRARIVGALLRASNESCPEDAHSALTWTLAQQVLERDASQDWQLLNNPGRLAIRTIDSFCAGLTRQMPILSGFGGRISPSDDALPLYREATRALLDSLGNKNNPIAADLAQVLLAFDGKWERLQELLVSMLMCRDQWLVHMGRGFSSDTPQQLLEHSVTLLIEDRLAELGAVLENWQAPLFEFYCFSCENRDLQPPLQAPGLNAADLPLWRAIAEMCLTRDDKFRKAVDKRGGFPPGPEALKAKKASFLNLLDELRATPGSLEQLREVRHLPSLADDDRHWQLLQAVSRLLPVLAAQLSLVFQARGEVDHTQIAMAALDALGSDDNVTDLAQKLDYRLRHILVDEFQDTAVTQYSLLERLTRGWAEENAVNPENPRTLFIVGDGMQSIYGFRDADVGLFVRAREQGFNGLTLHGLDLLCNFRSDAGLVEWVNSVFQPAFPAQDNIRFNEIRFAAAVPQKPATCAVPVTLTAFDTEDDARAAEALWLVDQIELGLASEDCETIAVLVRNRSHLSEIVTELKHRGISWQARDIDSLANSAVVRDLQNLCRALHNFGDRVAWLALLRAPWCALSLADLDRVSCHAGQAPLWQHLSTVGGLSDTGAKQLQRLINAIDGAMHWRERLGLRDWIESVWLSLGGPACVENPLEMQDAEEFLALLEARDNQGLPYDDAALTQQVASLYSSASSGDDSLQLMTMHKAKGLEFDWVFIPGLSRPPRSDQRELLLWDDYHRAPDSELGFLMAVHDEQKASEPTLYNYLQRQKKRQRESEDCRLLYVGVTRAAQRLFLSAHIERDHKAEDWKKPAERALLSTIWTAFQDQMQLPARVLATDKQVDRSEPSSLLRVTGLPDLPPATTASAEAEAEKAGRNIPDSPGDALPRLLGTAVHLSLQRLSALDDEALLDFNCDSLQPWWESVLRQLGVSSAELADGLAQVRHSVKSVLEDERGRHVISASREEAASELALSTMRSDGRLAEYYIDRSYVEDNVRWVVDYKSSMPDSGQSPEEFLALESERYREQLLRYRQLLAGIDERPIRSALYFTALPHWLELT
ncbi:MAG: UvrD-helicase domain-containing protein [Halieaceae bacterium]